MKKVHLLTIDPQVDFATKTGNLSVAGADEDMKRLAKMVTRLKDKLADVHVTLDSHHLVHVAHPIFWKDKHGRNPPPFTIITAQEVEAGEWRTTRPNLQQRGFEYVKQLEKNGRYPLCIWPPHCLIGSEGAQIVPDLFQSFIDWEKTFKSVDMVTKGSNVYTEHYSVFQADVPDPSDPNTQLNTRLIAALEKADDILIAGEALSHCVNFSIRDLVNNFNDPDTVKKMIFLKDASSPVTNFESQAEAFMKDMTAKGMRVTTTVDYLA
jgi:nicotinamidase/pyrazinamidase